MKLSFKDGAKIAGSWLLLLWLSSCGIRSISHENFPPMQSSASNGSLTPNPVWQKPLDVPSETNQPQEIGSQYQQYLEPYFSSLPYYCDPTEYPPNIVSSISACAPFFQDTRPVIDYRVKGDVGRRSGYDDDDDYYRRKNRRR